MCMHMADSLCCTTNTVLWRSYTPKIKACLLANLPEEGNGWTGCCQFCSCGHNPDLAIAWNCSFSETSPSVHMLTSFFFPVTKSICSSPASKLPDLNRSRLTQHSWLAFWHSLESAVNLYKGFLSRILSSLVFPLLLLYGSHLSTGLAVSTLFFCMVDMVT